MLHKRKSFRFLCDCISPHLEHNSIQKLKQSIEKDEVSWNEVIKIANDHVVVPALWYGMLSKGLTEKLDQGPFEYLQGFHDLNTQRNRFLKKLLCEVITVLNKIGVEPILFKGGASFFDGLFPDLGMRMMTDVDLIIREEDFGRCLEELYKIGYQHEKKESGEDGELTEVFKKGEFSNTLEFHFSLDKINHPDLMPVVEMWEKSTVINRDGLQYHLLSPTHQMIYHIVHCEVQHGNYEEGIVELRQLQDFSYKYLEYIEEIDWTTVRKRMGKFGFMEVFDAYWVLAQRLMNVNLAVKVSDNWPSRIHYIRVLSYLGGSPVFAIIRIIHGFVGNYSKERICQEYRCSDTFWAVSYARIHRLLSTMKKFSDLREFKRLWRYHTRY